MNWLMNNMGKVIVAWFAFVVGLIAFGAYALATADWKGVAKDAGQVAGAFREGMNDNE